MIAQSTINELAKDFCRLSFDEMVLVAGELMALQPQFHLENKYSWAEMISAWANFRVEQAKGGSQ